MASLHDVAKLAGVSKSTVSRVINNENGVKDSTKKRVEEAISEVGYMVNQVAKDLKQQRTNLVGVIVPRVSSHATSQGIDGISATIEQAGKHVLLANTHQSHQKEIEYIQIFNQKRVEGIILYATHLDQPLVEAIQKSHSPVVVVGQDGSFSDIPSVIHDDMRVGYEAGRRLVQSGCSQIGFIGVQPDDIAVDGMRSLGLQRALDEYGLTLLCHVHSDFSINSGQQLMKEILDKFSHVDGVFCATDRLAIGAIKALTEANIRVGDQVKILGVGNDELSQVCVPALSTFNYEFEKAGNYAAKMLLERIDGQGNEMSKLVLSYQVITRETCPL